MTNTQHTPGPWVPYNSDKGRIFSHWYIRVDSGPTIVTVHNGLPDNQDMGNAHLIAAAPAMYEALQAMLDGILYTRGAPMTEDRWRTLTTIARQAIAQAEGRQA